jgi:hypothetical protein
MMARYQTWARIDLAVHVVILLAYIAFLFLGEGIYALMLLIPLVIWEVLSGGICLFTFRQKRRKPYFLGIVMLMLIFGGTFSHPLFVSAFFAMVFVMIF